MGSRFGWPFSGHLVATIKTDFVRIIEKMSQLLSWFAVAALHNLHISQAVHGKLGEMLPERTIKYDSICPSL